MRKGTSSFPVKAITGALVTALVMKLFLFDFMAAEGHSMEPAILPGNIIFISKISYGLRLPGKTGYIFRWILPKKGDIVVFYTPTGETAVKRCFEIYEDNSFYLLGDNSSNSFDSRSYGPIPMDNIVGKVLGIR